MSSRVRAVRNSFAFAPYAMGMTWSLIVHVSSRREREKIPEKNKTRRAGATSEWKIHKRVLNIRVTQQNWTLAKPPGGAQKDKRRLMERTAGTGEQEEVH